MRRFAAILAAVLAALSLLVWEVCRMTGRLVMSVKQAISPGAVNPSGPDLVSDVGAAAENAVEALAPEPVAALSPVQIVEAWIDARLGARRDYPDVSALPVDRQAWLAELTEDQCRTLRAASATVRRAWLLGRERIPGVPPFPAREPESSPEVLTRAFAYA